MYRKVSSRPHYLSLCVTIRYTLISAYPHLAHQFVPKRTHEAQGIDPVNTFACLVEEPKQFLDEKEQQRSGGHSTYTPIVVVTKGKIMGL